MCFGETVRSLTDKEIKEPADRIHNDEKAEKDDIEELGMIK